MKQSDFPEAFNGEFKPALTKLRCPKCRSNTISLIEFVEASTAFEVVNGKLNREAGIHELGGFIGPMVGECRGCNHRWKLRGRVSNIEMVVTELDPETFKPLYEEGSDNV